MTITCDRCNLVFKRPAFVYREDLRARLFLCKCGDVTSIEDRGTHIYIWDDGLRSSFVPFPEWDGLYVVSVPIGWSLVPDPDHGVVLKHVNLHTKSAGYVHRTAQFESEGFFIVKREIKDA